jgi:putative flippase GtrA
MFDWRSSVERRRIFRFYQAGAVNALVGYGAYALFVTLGMNIYLAQITAHLAGMAFNFLTYNRYVFRGHTASLLRYLMAYAGQYVISVGALAVASLAGLNSYLAGLAAIVFISVVNYFVLKVFVYRVRGTN